MDIAHLRDFIAVVDYGSLTQAAARLYVTQPALSQRVAALESELGVQLFTRGPRGVTPTQAGQVLYRDAQHLVRQFDRLAGDVTRGSHQVHGPVAIGLPTTVAGRLAPALFAWTRHHHPGIYLQVFESMSGYLQELLALERLDLAILYRDDTAPVGPAETELYAEDLYLIGIPPPSIKCEGDEEIAFAELRNVPLVAPGARSNLRALVERAFAARGWIPNIVADVDSLGAMIQIAANGDACTVLPVSCVAQPDSERIATRRIISPHIERRIVVCPARRDRQSTDALDAVKAGIVEVTTAMQAEGRWPGIRLSSSPASG
ncbi:LysR substrate-binding domain-containing protein [Rhodococcus sp. NPDC057529]|uniref:LysR substrate-binding domain-containing protein n=1 Tax=Rhodococcus sp. NPDC057529 TaxID=3346158 RepID=UPI00366EAB4A